MKILHPAQITFLKRLRDGYIKDGVVYIKPMEPALIPSFKSIHELGIELNQMGLIDIKEAFCGPLKMKCGEYLINITEQGLKVIASL